MFIQRFSRATRLMIAASFGAALFVPAPPSAAETMASKGSVSLETSAGETEPAAISRSFRRWVEKLRRRIARTEAKHNKIVAVAAVRGAESDDPPPLYWKGRAAKGPVAGDELAEFDAALEAALEGRTSASTDALNAFLKSHPDSPLAADARQALQELNPAQP